MSRRQLRPGFRSSLRLHPLVSPLLSSRPSSFPFHQQVLSTPPPAHIPSRPLLCRQRCRPRLVACIPEGASSWVPCSLQLVPCAAAADGSSACVSLCSCLSMSAHRQDEDPSPCLGPRGSAGGGPLPGSGGFLCHSTFPPPPPGPLPGPAFLPLAHQPPRFTLRLGLRSLCKPFSLNGLDPLMLCDLYCIHCTCDTGYGLPWWLSGKESTCQCRRRRLVPWVGKIPWRQPTSVFLPGKSHGQGSLVGYSPRGHKRAGHDFMTQTTA